ncbi:MAG: septum formation initiator family protein [Flavobacteriia bacterium]|nr:septum formation initiator family protein [Flavobacteriia bacterium]
MSRWQTLRTSPWWKRLTNKYTLVTLFFVIWMAFLDSSSALIQWELDARLRALEDGIDFYQRELKETQRQLDELASDPDKLEKFARETYWMHKPGERVALVSPESESNE